MRMFVAVWPDDAMLTRLSRLELGGVRGVRLVPPGQWHITLRFLGEVDDHLVSALVDALRAAAEQVGGPVHCQVGPETRWFSGQRVLHLPVAGLDAAAAAVRSATVPLVPEPNHAGGPFRGHLTIARGRRRADATARTALGGVPFAASFDVESIDLVASELSTEGPRYTTRARVLLPNPPSSL